ncbi:MAG TPA: hypothetical protein VFW69_01330 [Mycobacterium sp.]|nr:hypothetical protein [Mycobacterium sp.]
MDDELRDQVKRRTDEAIAMMPGTRTPRHDRTDTSYDRPLAASRMAANIIDQISAQP